MRCKIVSMFGNWACGILFRDFDDAYGYARRNSLTRDFFGGKSRFAIVNTDAEGHADPSDRSEI